VVLENADLVRHDRSSFNPGGALVAARFLPDWIASRIFPFGFCVRRTLVSQIGYNRRVDEVVGAAFTVIPDMTTYRPARSVLSSRRAGGFVYLANRIYSRLEVMVSAALVDCWVSDDQFISRSEENKWYGGLRAGMFLDGETLYMLDYPLWSQNWQDRLRQHRLVCPCANPVVILYAEKVREPLAPGTRIRPFPWSATFARGVSSGLKSESLRFVNDPFYCRETHWTKGVYLDAQQEPEA
jgi:hypothetical protein